MNDLNARVSRLERAEEERRAEHKEVMAALANLTQRVHDTEVRLLSQMGDLSTRIGEIDARLTGEVRELKGRVSELPTQRTLFWIIGVVAVASGLLPSVAPLVIQTLIAP